MERDRWQTARTERLDWLPPGCRSSRWGAPLSGLGIRPERALIRYADSDSGTDRASYGHVPGPWSARAVAAAKMESSPARPNAVMSLIEDRRRRSRME